MHIKRRTAHDPMGHSSALNDILFILLMFFLIVATLANPNIVPVNNPKGDKESKAKQNIMVSVNKDQQFFIGSLSRTPLFFESAPLLIYKNLN